MFSTHKSLFSLTGAAVLMFVGAGAQAATYYVDVNAGSELQSRNAGAAVEDDSEGHRHCHIRIYHQCRARYLS